MKKIKSSLKFLFLLGILSVTFLTTGCIKYSYNIEIDNGDNIKISEIKAVNTKVMNAINPDYNQKLNEKTDYEISLLKYDGYKAEKYNEDDFSGLKTGKDYTISRFTNADLPAGFYNNNTSEARPVTVQNGFFKKTYKISWDYNPKNANIKLSKMPKINVSALSSKKIVRNTENSEDGTVDDSVLGVKPTMELIIKIPSEATSHNAHQVLGKNEYKWNLLSKTPVKIEIQYVKINWFNILLTIFVILVVFFVVVAAKNKDTDRHTPKF